MSSRRIALITLIISSVLWASSGTVAKILLPAIDPIPIAMLRLAVAVLILIPVYLRTNKLPSLSVMRDLWPIALASAGNFIFYILGIARTTANASAVIYTITPLFTFFLARAAIAEHGSAQKLWGIILGLLGVVAILLLPVLRHGQNINGDIPGNLLILLAVCCWTYFIVSSRRPAIQKKYTPLTITTVSMTVSFISLLLLTFVTPHRPFAGVMLTGLHPILILYYGAAVTVVTFLFQQITIKHSSAATASLTNYLQPVFAFIYNAVFLGEVLTPEFLIGSILVMAGTMLATGARTNELVRAFIARQRNG